MLAEDEVLTLAKETYVCVCVYERVCVWSCIYMYAHRHRHTHIHTLSLTHKCLLRIQGLFRNPIS